MLLLSTLVYTMIIIVALPSSAFLINAQSSKILDPANKTNNVSGEYNANDKKIVTFNHPFISPNPVGPAGKVNITANYSESRIGIDSIHVEIQGPNIGSTNPQLLPITIGSVPMLLLSGTANDGIWGTNFSFPLSLPDGNYLYFVTITDKMGHVSTAGPYSSIILDRKKSDPSETTIVSALDGTGKSLSNGGVTSSPDITFTFQGTDKTGVIQYFQCNLDDIIMPSEHGHGDEETQIRSAYYPCFTPTKIAVGSTGNHTYANLGVGNHTFKVRALDNENDFDASPSSFSWTILPPPNAASTTLLGNRIT
jgi:hypothetical protein